MKVLGYLYEFSLFQHTDLYHLSSTQPRVSDACCSLRAHSYYWHFENEFQSIFSVLNFLCLNRMQPVPSSFLLGNPAVCCFHVCPAQACWAQYHITACDCRLFSLCLLVIVSLVCYIIYSGGERTIWENLSFLELEKDLCLLISRKLM